MNKKKKNSSAANRRHRFLAVLLSLSILCGLMAGSVSAIAVRAADTGTPAMEESEFGASELRASESETSASFEESIDEEMTSNEAAEDAHEEESDAGTPENEEASETGAIAEEMEEQTQDNGAAYGEQAGSDKSSSEGGETAEEQWEEDAGDGDTAGMEPSEEGGVGDSSAQPVEGAETGLTSAVPSEIAEKAFADLTPGEQYQVLLEMTEEERKEAVATLSDEQYQALSAYILAEVEKEKAGISLPDTVVFTNAGPFMPPILVSGKNTQRRAKSAARGAAREAPEGLEIDKSAEANTDGTYTLTLEAYTTGDVISQESTIPVDIVLVLDQSGSMRYDFAGNDNASYSNSRQKALKDAVQSFIASVNDKYSESADHRISIVTFGSGAGTLAGWTDADGDGSNTLSGLVNNLPQAPSGATNVAAGMERAQYLVNGGYNYSGSNTQRQKVVIVFTDGIPTTAADFSVSVANGALSAADSIKNSGATVYTVGIFGGADPDELYGASGFTENSDGSVGSRWGAVRFLFFGDVDRSDVPAGNRFLNYLSSNFENATQIGLESADWNFLFVQYHGWRITRNFGRTAGSYYLTADSSSSLDDVFQSIAEQISTPTISLGTETVIKDIIAPQFTLAENSVVKIYTQPYNGDNSWGTRTEVTDGSVYLVPDTESDNVSVTGFDFNENCVTQDPKQDGSYGKKVIVEITVEPDPNFLGGRVKTNGDESGIVSEGQTIANFEVNPVDVPLKKIEPQLEDKNIYLSTEESLAVIFNKNDQIFSLSSADGSNAGQAVFADIFNGVNNAAVNVSFRILDGETVIETFEIRAGETAGSWSESDAPVLVKDSYTIQCVITDATDPANQTEGTQTAQINIFKPVLTYEDKNVFYMGEQIDVSGMEPVKIEWKHGNTKDTDVTMHSGKPELTYSYSEVSAGKVDQTGDYIVSVDKIGKIGDDEYDFLGEATKESVTFLKNCEAEELSEQPASAEEAFKIHVHIPAFSFADREAYYGDSISFTAPAPDWNNEGITMDNEEPTLRVELVPEEGAVNENGYVAVAEDFGFKAVVKAQDTDIMQTLINEGAITRTCDIEGQECGDNPEATAEQAFVVHVRTVSLTVTKKIEGIFSDKTAKYSFLVTITPAQETGIAGGTTQHVLGDGDRIEMDKLPKGSSVTVTEREVPANYEVSARINGTSVDVLIQAMSSGTEHTVIGELTEDSNNVVITNRLETVPVTGVDVPVIFLELFFAGGAFLALLAVTVLARRKKL